MYEVKNCPSSFIKHKYTVIRNCNDEAANDLPNGMLVESEMIVAIS